MNFLKLSRARLPEIIDGKSLKPQSGGSPRQIVLLLHGYGSSGADMMALHVGLRRRRTVSAVVGYSGLLTTTANLMHGDHAKPRVLLVHGTADPVVPIAALHHAEGELKRLGVPTTTHVSHGVAHSVDPVGMRLGRDFVPEALA